MKKRTVRFLTFVEITILLGALILFALQNPNTLTLFLDYTTKHLGLTYDRVTGNLLKTITVRNIRYHDRILTEEASIDWNLKALLTASLKIDTISVKDLDIPLTEQWIGDLRKKFGSSSGEKSTYIPPVEISELVFSARPFKRGDLNVSRIELQANDIKGDLQHVDVGFFSFLTESDYADITALGKIENGALSFEKLWLAEIDIPKIIALIKKIAAATETKKAQSGEKLIKSMHVTDLIVYTKPLHYRHYDIKNWSLTIRDLYTEDMKIFDAKHVFLDATTNMWRLSSSGRIDDNRLYTEADVILNDSYFKRFVPFFDHRSINPLKLYLTVDREGINGKLHAASKNLLISKHQSLKVAVPRLDAHVTFDFHALKMAGEVDADLTSLYTPRSRLRSHIYFDKTARFHYDGNLSIPLFAALPKTVLPLLADSNISFVGDQKHVTATLKSRHLSGRYSGTTYRKANLELHTDTVTPEMIALDTAILPKETKLHADARMPIDFSHFFPLQPRFLLQSSLADINGSARIRRDKRVTLEGIATQSSENLLKERLPRLNQRHIFPLKIGLTFAKKEGMLHLQNAIMALHATHRFDSNLSDINVSLEGQSLQIHGDIRNQCTLQMHTPSLRELQISMQKLYRFEALPMDGDLDINATLHALSHIEGHIGGKWFIYEYKPNHFLFAEKIDIDADYQNRTLTIARYSFNTYLDRDRRFFATKPSIAIFDKGRFKLTRLWINDGVSLRGHYRFDTQRGRFFATATNYHYNDLEGNFHFDTKLEILLTPKNTDIEGDIKIKGGTITYQHRREHSVQDDDIIIIQEQKRHVKEEDRLSLDISIVTTKPIYYKIPNTQVKLDADLKIWKEVAKPLELLGIIRVLGGTHKQSGKEFELESSEIMFGGDPLNPYLNIRAIHRSDPYTIYVTINGQLDAPQINFSASPYLNQSDILSILLFSTTTDELLSGSQDSSKTAVSMFGTVFAKEIVKNFGIQLDKLVLTTTEEGRIGVELGKKLSKKVTLIYINDIVQTIKIRYKISDHFESDFVFSPDNSGIDLIYKDEY